MSKGKVLEFRVANKTAERYFGERRLATIRLLAERLAQTTGSNLTVFLEASKGSGDSTENEAAIEVLEEGQVTRQAGYSRRHYNRVLKNAEGAWVPETFTVGQLVERTVTEFSSLVEAATKGHAFVRHTSNALPFYKSLLAE